MKRPGSCVSPSGLLRWPALPIRVVTTLPILLVHPFIQRYFVSGIRLVALKG